MNKSFFLTLLDNCLVFLWGIFFLLFPFIMSTSTTDAYVLPKEIAFTLLMVLSLLFTALKIILSEKVTFRRSPFDMPLVLFLLALVLSSLFSLNRADSLISSIPVVVAGLSVFVLGNVLRQKRSILFTISALLLGTAATAVLAVFSYLHVYPILFSFTHIQSFTPLGSLIEQACYFVFLLPIAVTFILRSLRPLGADERSEGARLLDKGKGKDEGKQEPKIILFAVCSLCIAAGLVVTLVQLFTTQHPVLLPFETGFQTAFAAISQDSGRIAQGFLLGSGFGTFNTDFTRFKQVTFNTSPLWANQFSVSSSWLLELLATTGILGMLSFLFLLFRLLSHPKVKKQNPIFLGIVLLALATLILPFSYIEISLLFVLIGLYVAVQSLSDSREYYDVEVKFVALKKGVIMLQQMSVPSHEKHEYTKPTAYVVAAVLIVLAGLVGWMGVTYTLADTLMQSSFVQASGSNGTATYKDEAQAITLFPYQSVYYRLFSQTNIALAGSLASLQKGSTPNSQTQSTLYSLLQQGITTAKQATTLSPETVNNWQNLSSVYRSLIGVGQNADNFAILASQQAITLDPNNPTEYIALGGLYYQLGQWDNATREFQQAIALKQDYANAYYNLGHAYEQKGDLQDALTAYQTVEQLVSGDKTNLAKIQADVATLQGKMNQTPSAQPTPTPVQKPVTASPATVQNQPLNLSGQQPSINQAGQSATPSPSQ